MRLHILTGAWLLAIASAAHGAGPTPAGEQRPRDDGYYVRQTVRALRASGMKEEAIVAVVRVVCRERDELLRTCPPTPTHRADR